MQSFVQTVYYSAESFLEKSHFHDCHQIILVLKGQVQVCVNETSYTAGSGDIILFSRYENHSIVVLSEEYERYVLHIDPAIVNGESPVYSLLSDRPIGFCSVISILPHLDDVVSIFERLLRERDSGDKLANEMQQLTVKQLLIMIYRCMPTSFEGSYDDVVIGVKRQFENHYSQPYTLTALSKQYNVSPSTLSHRFSAATGMSVMEYLLSCRMASAKRMLAGTKMGIGEIVERCGFSDNSNFSRTFKKRNGLSPSDFRKKYRAE